MSLDLVSGLKRARQLAKKGALFVLNHSGGKDSQVMYLLVRAMLEEMGREDQMLVVHCPLTDVEWEGCIEHIEDTIDSELTFVLAHAVRRSGESKTLLEEVMRKHKAKPDVVPWPDPQRRWCTSDFKTGPAIREAKKYADANGFQIIVNCLGLRAEESSTRAKRKVWREVSKEHGKRSQKCGWVRSYFEWLPIHTVSTEDVFGTIEAFGQRPHFAYDLGMSRLSCVFCIMASDADLRVAAENNPDLYARYVAMEQRVGHTMSMSGKSLPERTGIAPRMRLRVVA